MKTHPAFSLAALVAASLACSIFVGGPDLPSPPIVTPPGALQSLQDQIEQALAESAVDGTIHLNITQEQMTALLESRLAAQTDPVLTDPQVVFGDQQMVVYGRAKSGMFEANVALTSKFEIDADGRPDIQITSADVGPMPVPQAFRDALAATVDEALTGYVGPVALGFRLESIDISGGVMTISGRVR